MNGNSACFSKKSDDWKTPKELYDKLDAEFHFDFDPCPLHANFDGLSISWKKSNFVNPPYSQIGKWCEKAAREREKGNLSVLLIPARTDTKYFHNYVLPNSEIRFIKGRVKFSNKGSAPFPSILCIFRPKIN